MVRRSIEDPDELSAYTVFCAEGTTLEALAKVAGSRWRVEIGFEEAKGEVGLSHYEVRSWHGWYRHITLSRSWRTPSSPPSGLKAKTSRHHKRGLWGQWRAPTACWLSREDEGSRATDGL